MSEYCDGAKACREALRALTTTYWGDSNQTDAEYFDRQAAAISAILATAGPLSPRAAGAMAVLAEFVVVSEQDGSYLCLESQWKPWAAMTSEEQQERRNELAADQLL